MQKVTLIPGDGIGPEIVESAVRVVEASGAAITWERVVAGQCAIPEYGLPVPEQAVASIRQNRVALKGPLTNVVGEGFPSPNITLRVKLDLFANLRIAKSFAGVRTPFPNVDLTVIRESTEDVYVGKEQMVGDDAAVALKFITRRGARRAVAFAFEHAVQAGRKKVTVVLKANVMKLTDGMFLREARAVAKDYPGILFEEMNVDAQCMELVKKPEHYDVLVMPNLYGDIISDLAAGLVGSIGLCPGANYGDGLAVFEAAHGSAPKHAGKNRVNPVSMILSACLMLRHLGEAERAARIEEAVAGVIREGKRVTYDLGGSASTSGMTEAIVERV